MTLISICEYTAETDIPGATVSFDHGPQYPITLSNPLSEEEDAQLTWYFEYATHEIPPNYELAADIAESITRYGEALFKQVFATSEALMRYKESIQAGADTLRIEIIGSSPIHRMMWEALKDPDMHTPLALHAPIIRKTHTTKSLHISLVPSPTINILVISARTEHDCPHHQTIARPLLDTLAHSPFPVHIDLLRPSTYEALMQHMEATLEAWGPGYYHGIHMDTPTRSLSFGELQAQPNRYRIKNRYARNKLEWYEGSKPFFFLESSTEHEVDLVDAADLADIMMSYQVPMVLVAPCHHIGTSVIGCSLREQGVQQVIELRYPLTISGQQIFLQALYAQVVNNQPLSTAVMHARQVLASQKERYGLFGVECALEDWLLPTFYQQYERRIELRDPTPDEAILEEQRGMVCYLAPQPRYGFFGRDVDIIHVERLLLMRNVLLIRGMGGIGKTTFLHYLGSWWQRTGFVDQVFFFGYDEQAWTLEDIKHTIAQRLFSKANYYKRVFRELNEEAQLAMLIRRLRTQRHVIILDNLRSITGEQLAIQHTLPIREQMMLRQFLTELVPGKTLVLLGSRSHEEWLTASSPLTGGLSMLDVYDLPGLDDEAMMWFAERILRQHGITLSYHDQPQWEAFRSILSLLAGVPLVLEHLLPRLAHYPPTQLLDMLQPNTQEQGGTDPLATNVLTTDVILYCVEYTASNLSPGFRGVLSSLALFTGMVNQETFELYARYLQEQPALKDMPIQRWREIIQDSSTKKLLTPVDAMPGMLAIHPLFSYFLRDCQQKEGIQRAIETAFCQLYERVGGDIVGLLSLKDDKLKKRGQLLAQLEYDNLKKALALSLQAKRSFFSVYKALFLYLDARQDYHTGLSLSQTVLQKLQAYPEEQRFGAMGMAYAGVLDDIAMRLFLLSQYAEARATYQRELELIEKLQHIADAEKRTLIASAHYHLGQIAQSKRQWAQAETSYMQALNFFIQNDNRYEQASTYHQLGMVKQEQELWDEAESCYIQALRLFVESRDRYSQAWANHQLGMVKQAQEQWKQAETYYRQELQILIELNDRYEQARTYHRLGMVAQEQHQWYQAELYYQQALTIFLESQDGQNEARIYHQMGMLAQAQRRWSQAEDYYRKALRVFIELHNRYDQANTYSQLGTLAQARRQWSLAKDYYQQVLQIFIAFDDKHNQAKTYCQLGKVAQAQRHWMQAESFFQQALRVFTEIQERYEQAQTYVLLGMLARAQREWQEAREYYHDALVIFLEQGEPLEQASTYHKLCIVTQAQCHWFEAEDYAQKALAIYAMLQYSQLQANMYGQLGILSRAQHHWQQACDYYLSALAIYTKHNDTHNAGIIMGDLAWLWKESNDPEILSRVAAMLELSESEVQEQFTNQQ